MTKSWRDFDYGRWKKLDEKYDHVAFEKCLETCTQHENFDDWMQAMENKMQKALKECGGRPPWKPTVFYSPDGDILNVYLSDEESYARWLTPHVTVKLSQETDEIIGFQIWGLSRVDEIKEIEQYWKKKKPSKTE